MFFLKIINLDKAKTLAYGSLQKCVKFTLNITRCVYVYCCDAEPKAEIPVKKLQLLSEAVPCVQQSTVFTFNWNHVNRNYVTGYCVAGFYDTLLAKESHI